MLVAYLIMLREGIEGALIVGIVAGYLKQTGRAQFMPYVWLGVALAAAICVALAVALTISRTEFPQKQQEFFAGVVAFVATGILTSMIFWMKKAARSIKSEIHDSIDSALLSGDNQGRALVAMAFFAVVREGVETVFFLLATFQQSVGPAVPIGAVLGLASAVGVGAAITYGGYRLDLRRFFRWTSVLIVFVAAGLLAGGLRAFHEAGAWNGLQGTAFDLSNVLPGDSVLGTLLTGFFGYQDMPSVGEVLIYLAFLVPVLLLLLRPAQPPIHTARPA